MTCWAEPLSDCGGRDSREHYVSKGVFDKDLVTASGLSWCKGGKVEIGLTNAVAKILCEKHNSALSDFDSAAGDLSHFLLRQLRRNPEGQAHFSVNGWLLEKWALKPAINLAYLGAFGDRGNIPTPEHLAILFRDSPTPDGMGLYLVSGELDTRLARAGVHWNDIRNTQTSELVAVKLILNGVQLLACLVPERADRKVFSDKEHANVTFSYRPNRFVLEGRGRAGTKAISLVWT